MADLALLSVAFAELLRRAGLPATPEQAGRFAEAVRLSEPLTVTDVYWAARVTLVTGHDQLDTFDRVFAQVFGGIADLADLRGDPNAPAPASTRPDQWRATPTDDAAAAAAPLTDLVAVGGVLGVADGDESADHDAPIGLASREERLATTDFADLDADELAALYALMARLRVTTPLRPGRRARRHRRGDRLDVRATLRRSHRSGGDPAVQVWRRRQPRPRRLVVLCDISGSMEPYARAYVQFLHAAAGASAAHVFAFATRLTPLTRAVRVADPAKALARAASAAPDWSGGTRIGDAVAEFLDRYGRRGLARGAVVVILSDGWEIGDPAGVGEQMARLHRLAHRIVWINPRSAHPAFRPMAGGMFAALPYCDAVVSGHSVAALSEVVNAIADFGVKTSQF